MSTNRLRRETDPPAGMLASPVPQAKDRATGEWEDVESIHGAPLTALINPTTGEPFDTVPVADDDLKAELALVKAELADIKNAMADGTQKVQLSGQIQEFAVLSWDDVPADSVPAGSMAQLIGTDEVRQSDGEEWVVL